MWCPQCKTEYRDGIAICPECHSTLVEKLPIEIDTSPLEERLHSLGRLDSQEHMHMLSDGDHAYVERSKKYEDVKSTAASFLFVSILGTVLLILVYAGIIPLQFAPYMEYMMAVVMGGLFLIFFVIGIRSYLQLGGLKAQAAAEQQEIEAAEHWFLEQYSGKGIDITIDVSDTDELQQKYFLRSSFIKHSLQKEFPAYGDPFLDYLTERLYEALYPQD